MTSRNGWAERAVLGERIDWTTGSHRPADLAGGSAKALRSHLTSYHARPGPSART